MIDINNLSVQEDNIELVSCMKHVSNAEVKPYFIKSLAEDEDPIEQPPVRATFN